MTQMRFDGPQMGSCCICQYCGFEIVPGRLPAVLGSCVPCAEAEQVRKKRLYYRAERAHRRKPAARETWPEDKVFAGFCGEDE